MGWFSSNLESKDPDKRSKALQKDNDKLIRAQGKPSAKAIKAAKGK